MKSLSVNFCIGDFVCFNLHHRAEKLSFKNVITFNLDEYFPMQPNELQSYVRFMNELNVIRTHGGLIVKIERPGFDGANNHASETSLDEYHGWDRIIVNDGTLVEFKQKVETLARSLMADGS